MHSSGKSNSQDGLITPQNSVLLLIDYQPQPLFEVQSRDRTLIINGALGLAKAAKAFEVPTILTTLAAQTYNGPLLPELQDVFPVQEAIDRTTINAFEDSNILGAVRETKRKRLFIAGLCAEVSVCFTALSALQDGYAVQIVVNASGASTDETQQLANQQMTQAGAKPWTWQQVLLGWQRDWARVESAPKVRQILHQYGGTFGQGINYAQNISRTGMGQRLQAPRRGVRPAGMRA